MNISNLKILQDLIIEKNLNIDGSLTIKNNLIHKNLQNYIMTSTFEESGCLIVPDNVSFARVSLWGGGGGTGGNSTQHIGGGGGGGQSILNYMIPLLGTGNTIDVKVGKGGIGGIDNFPGSSGKDSKVIIGNTELIAHGGGAGGPGTRISNGGGGAGGNPICKGKTSHYIFDAMCEYNMNNLEPLLINDKHLNNLSTANGHPSQRDVLTEPPLRVANGQLYVGGHGDSNGNHGKGYCEIGNGGNQSNPNGHRGKVIIELI